MHKHQRRRWRTGKHPALCFLDPIFFKIKRSLAMTGAQSVTGPINHRQRHEACNIAPAIPKMKRGEIIRPHQPDKIDPGAALREMAQSIIGKVRTNRRLKITDDESGMISNLRAGLQPCW